jgi:hypothetical protein
MPTPTRVFHDVAARYGKVDPSDAEALERWFTEVLPTLPKEQIEEILEELLAHDGSQAPRTESHSYPQNVPLPSLEDSPPVTFSALKQLLSTLMARWLVMGLLALITCGEAALFALGVPSG